MGLPKQFDPYKMRSQLYEGIEYKEFWTGKSKNKLDELEQTIIRKLLPDSGYRMIDIGCGFGRLAECYLDRFQQIVMLDGSITLLKQAQETYKEKAVYIAADANCLPFRSYSFDSAVMIRVFHHLADSQRILSELKRVLGGPGYLIFNYCNKLSARKLIRRLIRLDKQNPINLAPVTSGKTMILHHPTYIHRMLIQTGFAQTEYFGVGVMDKLSEKVGQLEKWLPSGEMLAPFFGNLKLAPWIICKTQSQEGDAFINNNCIHDILVCPACYGFITNNTQKYKCAECNRSYPIEDGIADFRLDF
jgi:ubiquinone/menaquinone biosynthesis C-methylase UbiE